MKIITRNIITNLCFIILFSFPVLASATETYKVDPTHSSIVFKIKHLKISNTYGHFNNISGTIIADKDVPGNSSVEISVNSNDIDTNNAKRDKHLKSLEFLNIGKFKTISFKSTNVKKISESSIEVTGNLTLLGTSKKKTVIVNYIGSGKDSWGGYRSGFETTFTIKRSDFGMNTMIGPIGDKVTVIVNVEGIKK